MVPVEYLTKDQSSASLPQETMKKPIPELMIPSYETSSSQDVENQSNAISPDSNASTKRTTETDTTESTSSTAFTTSSSPNEEENLAYSPTNPSVPLTSPDKGNRLPPTRKNNSPKKAELAGNAAPKSPTAEKALNNLNAAPVPLSQRGRVVSLDRGGYLKGLTNNEFNQDEDDDDLSSSSVGSSDGEGSYFSEHLPSPKSTSRKYGNPPLLPPGIQNARSNRHLVMPLLPSQKSGSFNHESDLSLSSSSCEDVQSHSIFSNSKAYSMTRTKSAPIPSTHQPQRSPEESDLNLTNPDALSVINDNTFREVIGAPPEDYLNLPLPKNVNRFPSTSSLVSSSSEDCSERKKHRRQESYMSVGSITSAGSVYLPPKQWQNGDVDSDVSDLETNIPPEHVSFGSRPKSSSIRNSSDPRLPFMKKNPAESSNKAPRAILNDDQLNAWRNGIVRTDSYMSSSNGNTSGFDSSPGGLDTTSPSRSKHSSNTVGNKSTSSKGSGIYIYSDNDTDDSLKEQRDLMTAQSKQEQDKPGADMRNSRRTHTRNTSIASNRSFGRDVTNAVSVEPTPRNAVINPTPVVSVNQRRGPNVVSSLSSHSPSVMMAEQAHLVKQDDSFSNASTRSYKVYWQRWLMLMYLALLNLLSDWTCFSVAPIASLAVESYNTLNPEHLVTAFLLANTFATALEPIILSRLGLRKTVVFGAFLLMCGSAVKSGGIPGLLGSGAEEDIFSVTRLYAGFILVGLSQPLYQCTPSIFSCSWFPEDQRTTATGIALNANQLGIGSSFVFGTLMVATKNDISNYFGLLSILSALLFVGCYLQFQDAPPTPPSESARVIRGRSIQPLIDNIRQRLPMYYGGDGGPNFHGGNARPMAEGYDARRHSQSIRSRERTQSSSLGSSESRTSDNRTTESDMNTKESRSSRRSRRSERKSRVSPSEAFSAGHRVKTRKSSSDRSRKSSSERSRQQLRSVESKSLKSDKSGRVRRSRASRGTDIVPAPASGIESTEDLHACIARMEDEAYGTIAPSPMMSGRVGQYGGREAENLYNDTPQRSNEYYHSQQWQRTPYGSTPDIQVNGRRMPAMSNHYGVPEHLDPSYPDTPFANLRGSNHPMSTGSYMPHPPPMQHQSYEYGDVPMPPSYHHRVDPNYYVQQSSIPPQYYHYQSQSIGVPYHHIPHQMAPPMQHRPSYQLPPTDEIDDGAEPILTQAGPSLGIEIQDDQIIRSIRACFSRPGFIHTVVAFAVSGIVLNTISTYMDYLVRLGGSGRGVVGFVGGLFQVVVMISSMIVGRITDKTRAYYWVVLGLLVLGAFALAECNINLDAERGYMLKWSLLVLAFMIGPLQPIATELGVDVAYPLSENTVLVIQQLVSNLLSALFIPFFQAVRNYGIEADGFERPQYTFSFYMLIVIHAVATVVFSCFNGQYRRLAYEQEKKREHYESKCTTQLGHRKDYLNDEEQQVLMMS